MKRLSSLKHIFVIIGCCLLVACASGNSNSNKVDSKTGQGEDQVLFAKYKEDRPERTAIQVGNPAADVTLSSIANIYGITADLFDKYSASVENAKVASQAEVIRQEKGDEEYKKFVSSLKGEDRRQYDEFLKNEINTLGVVKDYLVQAVALQQAASRLDAKAIASNPMQIPSVAKGITRGVDQIKYTIETLKWLNDTMATYKAALAYKGK